MKSAHGTNPDSAVMSHISTNIDMKIRSRQSHGVSLKKFMSAQHRNQTEEVKELVLLKKV